jgi:hypothetical protein
VPDDFVRDFLQLPMRCQRARNPKEPAIFGRVFVSERTEEDHCWIEPCQLIDLPPYFQGIPAGDEARFDRYIMVEKRRGHERHDIEVKTIPHKDDPDVTSGLRGDHTGDLRKNFA